MLSRPCWLLSEFLQKLSTVATTINDLLRGKVNFAWSLTCPKAFEQVKRPLCSNSHIAPSTSYFMFLYILLSLYIYCCLHVYFMPLKSTMNLCLSEWCYIKKVAFAIAFVLSAPCLDRPFRLYVHAI